ncbi:hypothetical protein WS68_10690 [Burkholderia sp. TSV86]|nr:hypothetical protein WS68_10690 [Burkholderia sp. TSV86]
MFTAGVPPLFARASAQASTPAKPPEIAARAAAHRVIAHGPFGPAAFAVTYDAGCTVHDRAAQKNGALARPALRCSN